MEETTRLDEVELTGLERQELPVQHGRGNGFSIIIPTYNRADLLKSALQSVQKLHVPEAWSAEILVINNNSTDHTDLTAQEAAQQGPIPLRICHETKQGASHSRNRALSEAQFEHLVYLDDDMVVDEGWLLGYLEVYRQFKPDLVVGPVEARFEEVPGPDFTQSMLNSVTSSYSRKGDDVLLLPPELGHEVPGCNFAVLRSTAIAVGRFETRIDRSGDSLLGGGDWDLGRRIVSNGGKVAYSPKCRIEHFISRQKMSRHGMRRRWRDLGRTHQAWEQIQGQHMAPRRRCRLILHIGCHYASMAIAKITGKSAQAFEHELFALRLRGYVIDRKVIHED